MDIKDKVIVVTGAASGIGAALCRRFHQEGAAHIVAADINEEGVSRVAAEVKGLARRIDVRSEADVAELVRETGSIYGRLDLYCSNAGIFVLDPGGAASASNADWQRTWEINVMAHVYAARAAVPVMVKQGGGHFLITASAAGLLSQIGSAPYSVTKHAAVAFAESLAITHGDEGIGVSVMCPQAVRTGMTDSLGGPGVAGLDGMLEPDILTDSVISGLAEGSFLILPHPEVATYLSRKVDNYDRWLHGMRRLRKKYTDPNPTE